MHSTQKGKWLDVSTSFPALACGTSPRPLMSELLYWLKVNKASRILCCPWIQKQCGCLCQSEAADDLFHMKWRRQRAKDEIGPAVVSGGARLGPPFPAVLWRYICHRLCWSDVFIVWPVYLPRIFTGWCDNSSVQWEERCSSWRITLCVYTLLYERFMQK